MKKKLTNEIVQRRKLVLPREVIAVLNRPQLGRVGGGVDEEGETYVFPCIQTLERAEP
jgi:hypothetical protein